MGQINILENQELNRLKLKRPDGFSNEANNFWGNRANRKFAFLNYEDAERHFSANDKLGLKVSSINNPQLIEYEWIFNSNSKKTLSENQRLYFLRKIEYEKIRDEYFNSIGPIVSIPDGLVSTLGIRNDGMIYAIFECADLSFPSGGGGGGGAGVEIPQR